MFRLAIDDNLLIKQTGILISPWSYRILHIPTLATVKSQASLTSEFEVVALDEATFGAFEKESLLVEILNGSSQLIESDILLISGAYNKFPELKVIAGLLGENLKKITSLETDFQDGFEKHANNKIFTDSTLVTEIESFEKDTSYVDDFIPDARYQIRKINALGET